MRGGSALHACRSSIFYNYGLSLALMFYPDVKSNSAMPPFNGEKAAAAE